MKDYFDSSIYGYLKRIKRITNKEKKIVIYENRRELTNKELYYTCIELFECSVCSSLTSIDLSSFNTNNIINMCLMFSASSSFNIID